MKKVNIILLFLIFTTIACINVTTTTSTTIKLITTTTTSTTKNTSITTSTTTTSKNTASTTTTSTSTTTTYSCSSIPAGYPELGIYKCRATFEMQFTDLSGIWWNEDWKTTSKGIFEHQGYTKLYDIARFYDRDNLDNKLTFWIYPRESGTYSLTYNSDFGIVFHLGDSDWYQDSGTINITYKSHESGCIAYGNFNVNYEVGTPTEVRIRNGKFTCIIE